MICQSPFILKSSYAILKWKDFNFYTLESIDKTSKLVFSFQSMKFSGFIVAVGLLIYTVTSENQGFFQSLEKFQVLHKWIFFSLSPGYFSGRLGLCTNYSWFMV